MSFRSVGLTIFASAVRTAALLALLAALLVLAGRWLGGTGGMLVAAGMAALLNLGTYWCSDRLVLGLAGARELARGDAPDLFRQVAVLARRAGLPMPRVYLVDDPTPNAFATGRGPRRAAVAVTTGLLRLLDRRELRGVLAHELAHIRHRDTLTSAIVATIAGAITMLAELAQWAFLLGDVQEDDEEAGGHALAGGPIFALVAPLAAALVQFAISRTREYAADAAGAAICGDPLALASALRTLAHGSLLAPTATRPALAHLYIVNPFAGSGGLLALFSTHPPIGERIARLEALAYSAPAPAYA